MSDREPDEATDRTEPTASRRRAGLTASLAGTAFRLLAVIGILLTLWSAWRLEPWQTSEPSSPKRHSEIAFANVNPIGVNTFLANEVEIWKRERTLEMVAELGAGWIRQGFPWNEIEPARGEHWDARYQQDSWAKFDNIVDLAEQHGIRIIARLDQTPEWARPAGTTPATPPSDFEDFGNFVHEFVSRYRGRISYIQIWNEPNLAREWGGAIDPAGYASLLEIAARRAREANPDIIILSAPMAMTTENSPRAADEFVYWQALYDHGIADSFDIMSANVYGLSEPYDAEPDFGVLNVRRVELLRELAVRNGDGDKPIWFNEYGWNASPEDFPQDALIWSRVKESQQADWTADGIRYASEHWDWFGVANIWYFRHVGDISPSASDYYFRMVDVEFTPRDVYRAVQRLASSLTSAGKGDHGLLEASTRAFGAWPVIRNADSPHGYAVQSAGSGRLEIRFHGSALDLHLLPNQNHGTITVSIKGESGSRTIDLPESGGMLRVTSGLLDHPSAAAAKDRVAVIQVNQDSQLSVDYFTVSYAVNYLWLLAGGGITIAGLAGSFFFRRRTASVAA